MRNVVKVGNVYIGGNHPVSIQSMTNTLTSDVTATVEQINALQEVGCDIVRVSVPDKESALSLRDIKRLTSIPVVCDIHYDYKLAILSVENGADKIRINPGNIGTEENIKYLADFLRERGIPIRIGVNSGSIEKHILNNSSVMADKLYQSAVNNVRLLEKNSFYDIILSVKSSNVMDTVSAYEKLHKDLPYPLHIGVTEAGVDDMGIVKSSLGIGILLNQGIGDTIRVSLTGDPIREVLLARRILQALNILDTMPEIISCPTCARTCIDVENIAKKIDEMLCRYRKHIKVAVMGCVVNGPGEAKEADIGIAGGKEKSALFVKGQVIATVNNEDVLEELMKRIRKYIDE